MRGRRSPWRSWVRDPLGIVTAFAAVIVAGSARNDGAALVRAADRGQTAAASQTVAFGFISGQVVDGTTGRPITAAAIRSFAGRDGNDVFGQPGFFAVGTAVTAMTDVAGRFTLKLPAGRYTIRVSRSGYRSLGYLQDRPEDGGAGIIGLKEGQRREITFKLWKDSSLEGRVVDEGLEPLPSVEVSALRRTFLGGRAQYRLEARAETDDQGRYRFAQLPTGDYIIGVASGSGTWPTELVRDMHEADQDARIAVLGKLGQSGAPAPTATGLPILGQVFDWFGPQGKPSDKTPGAAASPLVYYSYFHPNSKRLDTANVVRVDTGRAITNIDVALGPPVETQYVTGRLLGPEGRTAGVAVSLVPVDLNSLHSTRGFEIATGVTDSVGRFVILGVPSGAYVLQSTHGGRLWAPSPGSPASLLLSTPLAPTVTRAPNRSGESIFSAATEVTVGDEPVRDVPLVLRPGLRASGRIVLPVGQNAPADRHVADTIVRLEAVDRSPEGAHVNSRPDAAGNFRTPEYVPGRYRFVFSHIDQNWRVAQILVNGQDVIDGLIELTEHDLTDVVVILTDKDGALSGRINDDDATRALQPRIVVFSADVEHWIARGMSPLRASNSVRANEAGEFHVPSLLPGRYFAVALSPDSRVEIMNPEWIRYVANLATLVEIKPGTKPTVMLRMKQLSWK